jgi:transposase
MYIDILRRLRDAVCWKHPVKWRTENWFLFRDNAPAHRSVLVKNFLANNNVTTLEYPPYSPDLVTADFYIFPQLISALKGRSCSESTDSNKSVAESGILYWLKRL